MESKRKRILLFLGSLFIAVMFIGSYAAFGNNSYSSTTTATTTVAGGITYFVSGNTNGILLNYSSLATIMSKNASVSTQVGNYLAQLENNGSVSNYVAEGNNFEVFSGKYNAYQLQQGLYIQFNSTTLATVNASSILSLPSTLPLYYRSQLVPVRLSQVNFSVSVSPLVSIGSNVPVTIHALVYNNGTVSNGQITVMQS